MLLRGVGTLRYLSPPSAAVQWQPDGSTIHTEEWFLGDGFLGAPPISLRHDERPGRRRRRVAGCSYVMCVISISMIHIMCAIISMTMNMFMIDMHLNVVY